MLRCCSSGISESKSKNKSCMERLDPDMTCNLLRWPVGKISTTSHLNIPTTWHLYMLTSCMSSQHPNNLTSLHVNKLHVISTSRQLDILTSYMRMPPTEHHASLTGCGYKLCDSKSMIISTGNLLLILVSTTIYQALKCVLAYQRQALCHQECIMKD